MSLSCLCICLLPQMGSKKSSHQEGSMFSLYRCESVQMSPRLLQMTPNPYQSDDTAPRAAYWYFQMPPGPFSDIFLNWRDLFPEPVTVRWNCFFSLQHFVISTPFFMVFWCFWRGKIGCWYSKRVTHPSSLLIHSIFHCAGKAVTRCLGPGQREGGNNVWNL